MKSHKIKRDGMVALCLWCQFLLARSGFDKVVTVWYHILPEYSAEIRATKRATIISIPGKLEQEKKAIHSIGATLYTAINNWTLSLDDMET